MRRPNSNHSRDGTARTARQADRHPRMTKIDRIGLENLKDEQRLISIEHNLEWYEKVKAALADHPRRSQLTYLFIPPEVNISFYGSYVRGNRGTS